MTIHFFTKEDELPGSSRQRAFRVAEELNARGVVSVVHRPSAVHISTTRWPKKFLLILATIRSLFSIKKDDIVFLHRTISNKYFFVIIVVYLFLFRRKMVFDFDDAIYLHDHFKTKILTQMADAVVVCSRTLSDWAGKYNKNVHIIHTSLKYETYARYTKVYAETNSCVVGWVGTASDHYKNLQLLALVFTRLVAKRGKKFKFVLVGAVHHKPVYDLFLNIPGLDVEFVDNLDWANPQCVPEAIQKFDIGIMPLVDTGEWNNARSSFKVMEYMACGVVSLSSAVGEVKYVIEDGVNGALAGGEDAWVEKLEALIKDYTLRAKLGAAGQKSAREQYCYEANVPRLIEIFKNL